MLGSNNRPVTPAQRDAVATGVDSSTLDPVTPSRLRGSASTFVPESVEPSISDSYDDSLPRSGLSYQERIAQPIALRWQPTASWMGTIRSWAEQVRSPSPDKASTSPVIVESVPRVGWSPTPTGISQDSLDVVVTSPRQPSPQQVVQHKVLIKNIDPDLYVADITPKVADLSAPGRVLRFHVTSSSRGHQITATYATEEEATQARQALAGEMLGGRQVVSVTQIIIYEPL